jgi:hypothetical protein
LDAAIRARGTVAVSAHNGPPNPTLGPRLGELQAKRKHDLGCSGDHPWAADLGGYSAQDARDVLGRGAFG